MKIKTVDVYHCDNPKCRAEFELSEDRSNTILIVETSKVWETTTKYKSMNGASYCRPCTLKILNAMGR